MWESGVKRGGDVWYPKEAGLCGCVKSISCHFMVAITTHGCYEWLLCLCRVAMNGCYA